MSDKKQLSCGWIFKKPDKGLIKKWRKRWFVLRDTSLEYYKSDASKETPLGTIDLTTVTQVKQVKKDKGGKEFTFAIQIPGRTYTLRAPSANARSAWISKIQSCTANSKQEEGEGEDAEDESSSPLQKQEDVDLSEKEVDAFPKALFKNVNLTSLNLSHNEIETLPDNIGTLSSTLIKLNISYNALNGSLPSSLGDLRNLKELNVHKNALTSLPDSLSKLDDLELLWISQNKISTFPSFIPSLLKITKLSLAYNPLSEGLSESISKLQSLRWLDVSGCQLTELPDAITECVALKVLEARSNKLTSLPEGIACMTGLEQLSLARNQLTRLSEGLGKERRLQEIDVSGNQLKTLPLSLAESQAFLECHNNPFDDIPEKIRGGGIGNIKKYLKETTNGEKE